MENALILNHISFSYKNKVTVIDDFSLEVEKGSFTTLLGSSGSGKTTLLRLISGFLMPSAGEIIVGGKTVNSVVPEKRNIGMVFQDYALFPHMTVEQNLMYGLKLKNKTVAKKERKTKEQLQEQILETLKILNLEAFDKRYPGELSGGQQQRVALGRALVLEPSILLMDEPLSSLDTNLRQSVRSELKEIQQRLGITTVYVTHDQEEALCLSDKIAVLDKGKLVQYGTSRQVYFEPANKFTAEFVGAANFITIDGIEYLVRPEWIELSVDEPDRTDTGICLKGTVLSSDFYGNRLRCKIKTSQGIITADVPSSGNSNIQNAVRNLVYVHFVHYRVL